EEEHQDDRNDKDSDATGGVAGAGGSGVGRETAAFQKPGEDRERDDREDAKRRAEPVESAVGIVDGEGQWIVIVAAGGAAGGGYCGHVRQLLRDEGRTALRAGFGPTTHERP